MKIVGMLILGLVALGLFAWIMTEIGPDSKASYYGMTELTSAI